jgi:hypothetical protein
VEEWMDLAFIYRPSVYDGKLQKKHTTARIR